MPENQTEEKKQLEALRKITAAVVAACFVVDAFIEDETHAVTNEEYLKQMQDLYEYCKKPDAELEVATKMLEKSNEILIHCNEELSKLKEHLNPESFESGGIYSKIAKVHSGEAIINDKSINK